MIDARFQPMAERVNKSRDYKRSQFAKGTITQMNDLERELQLLEAVDIVIESGHERKDIRNDGWPRGGTRARWPDIRVFFTCKHGSLSYTCAAFDDWQANLRAIGLWMQRQRLAIEEWGIGASGEAYRGFAALPPSVSGEFATVDEAFKFLRSMSGYAVVNTGTWRDAYRAASFKHHPDKNNGIDANMKRINKAKEVIEKFAGAVAGSGAHA